MATPCPSCPYRRDARPEFWHPTEFVRLLANDANSLEGGIYHCHQGRKLPPEGWLLDQKKRGLPSIKLRLLLLTNPESCELLETVHDGGLSLYDSIEEMCEANGVDRRRE